MVFVLMVFVLMVFVLMSCFGPFSLGEKDRMRGYKYCIFKLYMIPSP